MNSEPEKKYAPILFSLIGIGYIMQLYMSVKQMELNRPKRWLNYHLNWFVLIHLYCICHMLWHKNIRILVCRMPYAVYAHNQNIQFGHFVRDLCLNKFIRDSIPSFMIALFYVRECMNARVCGIPKDQIPKAF